MYKEPDSHYLYIASPFALQHFKPLSNLFQIGLGQLCNTLETAFCKLHNECGLEKLV